MSIIRLLLAILALVRRPARRLLTGSGRVPVIHSMTDAECGAACLAMIVNFFGRQTSMNECRMRCGVGRDGVTARAIAEAAREMGLRTRAFSIEPPDLKLLPLPAIAHWGFNHFVVLERWRTDRVEIVDPSNGRRTVTTAEFDEQFTGVVLTMEPGTAFARRRQGERMTWTDYVGMIWRTPSIPGAVGQILAATLVLQVLGLAFPVLTKVLIDDILPYHVDDLMSVVGIGLAVVVVTQAIAAYLRSALVLYLHSILDARLMLGFFEHLLSLPFQFFQQRGSGDILGRMASTLALRETLSAQMISMVLDASLVLVYLSILIGRDLTFGLIVLAIGAAQVTLLIATSGRMRRLSQSGLAAQDESQGYLIESLKGMIFLKGSAAEQRALDHWSNLFYRQLNISIERGHLESVIETALSSLRMLTPALLLWVGAQRVLDGSMSLGTMLALNALAATFLQPLASLVSSGQQLQAVGSHLERIADVLEAEPEQAPESARRTAPTGGRIEVRNISYRYDPSAPLVLRDISFEVEPGQKIALVGRTGCGKSTLAMLLLGLYQPTSGALLLDGVPLNQLDYQSLRRQFGLVLQESFLFRGSVRQNIAFHEPELPLDRVIEAARLADIAEEIDMMSMGYETLIAESGIGLSGGQRQRLAIARALARRPSILLLDEATSQLDAVTEALVDRNLNDLACTRIVIAHRLSTIRNADLILVLDRGEIVERGTHEQLLRLGGQYTNLVRAQMDSQPSGVAALSA